MNEFWFQVRVQDAQRPVVVVDVSTAAEGLWPVFLSTLEGLAEELSADRQPDVVFLGSHQRFPLRDFLGQSERLVLAHRGRGRVLSPLLDSWGARWPARVAVLVGESVHDLADWQGHPMAPRLRLYSPSAISEAVAGPVKFEPLTDVQSIRQHLEPPPPTLKIRAKNALPFAWDQPVYFVNREGHLSAPPGVSPDVRVGFLASGEALTAQAELQHADGSLDRLRVLPGSALEPASWSMLSPAEFTILESWRGGRPIHCPSCGVSHPPGEVCRLGQLFPSLAQLPLGGFVVVRVQLFQAMYQPYFSSAFKWSPQRVLVHTPSDTAVRSWRWSAETHWQLTNEEVPLFQPLDSPDQFLFAMPNVRASDG